MEAISKVELLVRSCEILNTCATDCSSLQGTLSRIVSHEGNVSASAIVELQAIDKLQQQIEDLRAILFESANQLQESEQLDSKSLLEVLKLQKSRLVFEGDRASSGSDEIDLF